MIAKIPTGSLNGSIEAPPSKSITHRLFIMGALSGKECVIQNPLFCEDTEITLKGLRQLGFEFEISARSVHFGGRRNDVEKNSRIEISVSNSGTSARFLTAVAALLPVECVIDGSPRMRNRPMMPLIKTLRQLGAEIEHHERYLPLRISGGNLSGGEVEIDSTLSSQFLSALLLIAPYFLQDTYIYFGNSIASKPYSDMTITLMKKFGINVEENEDHYQIKGCQFFGLDKAKVEGDFSNAAIFMIGTVIGGGRVEIKNLSSDSIQGDKVILEMLQAVGTQIQIHPDQIDVSGGEIVPIEWDMQNYPDLIPTIAVMALFSKGNSRLRNVANLRLKESDRLMAIIGNVQRLGGRAHLEENDLIIEPCRLKGALLSSHNDHRIAMSFAMAGIRIPCIQISDPGCVKKSYPNFWNDFHHLLK
jgi:3-phosphoshikimate 1-carboxyvinyltransferase